MDAANVVNRVIQSAVKVGFENYSSTYGYGLIDAENALLAELPQVSKNPLGSLSEWVELYREQKSEETSPGEIVTPIDTPVVEIDAGIGFQQSPWLPLAGYAGLGLLATFLYFAFRPKAKGPSSNK
jgi:hypothetical protein